MPQSIKCTECGATMKSAKPIPAGKKVKCPKCAKIFTVQDEEEEKKPIIDADDDPSEEKEADAEGEADDEKPAKKSSKKGSADVDDDPREEKEADAEGEADDEKPAKKSSKKGSADAGDDKEPPKKGKGMLIGLIAGGVLLLCCCTSITGSFSAWYFGLFGSGNASEKAIVGVWREGQVEFDFRADRKLKRGPVGGKKFDLVYKFVEADSIQIDPDSTGNNQLNGQPYPTIRYKIDVSSDTLKLTETSTPAPGEGPERYTLKRQ